MEVKFVVTFEDGEVMSSHDDDWHQILDHANILPPAKDKKWRTYSLVSSHGNIVEVNFQTGVFKINNSDIHPATPEQVPLTYLDEPHRWFAEGGWAIYNDSQYFPIVGRRQEFGQFGSHTLYMCGWRTSMGGKTYEKTCFLYPDGRIVLT